MTIETDLTKEEVERAIQLLIKGRERSKLRSQRLRDKARAERLPKEPKEPKERKPREHKEPKPRKSRAGIKPAKSYYVPTGRPRGRPRKEAPPPPPAETESGNPPV